MKNWCYLIAVIGLLLVAFPTRAQIPKKTSSGEPACFIGIHFFQSNYEVFLHSSSEGNGTTVVPWQITAGGSLFPRLALQVGYTYRHEQYHLDPSYTGTNLAGQYVSGTSDDERWTHCVPLLARYTAISSPNHRLQMELLLGLTLLHTSLLAAAENRVNGQVILSRSTEAKATQGYFSGGLGLRYPFGRHFEGVLDWTYSRNVQSASEGVHLNAVGNKLGLTRALSLGLRYRFAVKKKVAVASGS